MFRSDVLRQVQTIFVSALVGFFTHSAFAELVPIAYYGESFYISVEEGLSDQNLLDELHDILTSGHIEIDGEFDHLVGGCQNRSNCIKHEYVSYKTARKWLFGHLHLETDFDGEYFIETAYCREIITNEDLGSKGLGEMQIPNHRVLNAEHTWPQSRFSRRFSTRYQKSDLHTLYPVLSNVNSARSNTPFADVDEVTSQPCENVRAGYSDPNIVRRYFEPAPEHKGNVARALFYFSTRYQLEIDEFQESWLKYWHEIDPVDFVEIWRNEEIYAIQGTRNPFIDHPELVEFINNF